MGWSVYQYCTRLEKRGFKELGQGCFSRVYAKPGCDKVIKVSYNNDMGWVAFVLWAQRSKYHSPHVPKLYSLKFHKDFYVAVIERLPIIGAIDCETRGMMDYNRSLTCGVSRADELEDRYPGFGCFLLDLAKAFPVGDLHDGNYGHRADGSIVVFDPIADFNREYDANTPRQRYSSCRLPRMAA